MVLKGILITWPLRFNPRLSQVPEKRNEVSFVIEDEEIKYGRPLKTITFSHILFFITKLSKFDIPSSSFAYS
jgi:hypothetical protein